VRLNQGDLLQSQPALELVLSGDGHGNVAEWLERDEFPDSVPRGKSGHLLFAMLLNTALDIARHDSVKHARSAGHDVKEVGVHGLALLCEADMKTVIVACE